MQNILKIIFLPFIALFAAAVLSGCSAPESPLSFQGTDACEHAKLMLIKANNACAKDCGSFFPRVSGNAQNQVMVASHAVKAACANSESESDDGETWACAEGHSCR